jgi:hypothetical protein
MYEPFINQARAIVILSARVDGVTMLLLSYVRLLIKIQLGSRSRDTSAA